MINAAGIATEPLPDAQPGQGGPRSRARVDPDDCGSPWEPGRAPDRARSGQPADGPTAPASRHSSEPPAADPRRHRSSAAMQHAANIDDEFPNGHKPENSYRHARASPPLNY